MRKLTDDDYAVVYNIVNKLKNQNLYLYIDLVSYGIESEEIQTFYIGTDEEIKIIVYEYYKSIQLMQNMEPDNEDISQLVDFITKGKYKRLSGPASLLERIRRDLPDVYDITIGYILRYSENDAYNYPECRWAKKEDMGEIAELICNDKEFGRSYDYSNLVQQLEYRNQFKGCKNLCVRVDGRIITHFGVFAQTDEIAVLSGMVTAEEYRMRGYGGKTVRMLSSQLLSEGKTPYIYLYNTDCLSWYKNNGYVPVGDSAKLDLRQ